MPSEKLSEKGYDASVEKYRAWWLLFGLLFVFLVSLASFVVLQVEWLVPENKGWAPYLGWTLSAIVGGSSYLLINVAKFYSRITQEEARFVDFTPWYISTLFTGPVFAVVVLGILCRLQIGIGEGSLNEGFGDKLGLGLALGGLPAEVLNGVAFILGFYSRMTRFQLDIMASTLFNKAWNLFKGRFSVVGPDSVQLGGNASFSTESGADVVWTATPGSIDPASGIYTAPDTDHEGEQALIQATLKSDPSIVSSLQISLVTFEIQADAEVAPETQLVLQLASNSLNNNELSRAVWAVSSATLGNPGSLEPTEGKRVVFTAPKLEDTEAVSVVFTATIDDRTVKHSVEIKPNQS